MSDVLAMIGFLAVASTIWGGGHYYVFRRMFDPLRLSKKRRRLAGAAAVAVWALGPVTFVGERFFAESAVWEPVRWTSFTYMGLFSATFAFVVFRDIAFLAARLAAHLAKRRHGIADKERRRFLLSATNGAIAGVSGVLAGWGFAEAVRVPEVLETDVPIADLPDDLVGYRIAQISDIHIGPTIKGDWLRQVVEKVNALDADLVAVTGDLVDGTVADLGADVAPLGDLGAADGVYFVTGNHEYYWDAEAWCAEVERLGLTVLVNAHRVVDRGAARLLVAGATDYRADRHLPEHASDPQKAREGAPDVDLSLLLAHQPRSASAAADAGYDLVLSGHTHGGQFFPWSLFVGIAHPFTAGLDRLRDTYIYVNRGTGYWGPPHRGGVPSEITLLTLRRA